mmetsp:Transcript_57944/g.130980  ORF Transcript_57944/g.130980 Transcript_57944/m.130980 type:complete len:402 (-) Transcript_57944:249-1454(-)
MAELEIRTELGDALPVRRYLRLQVVEVVADAIEALQGLAFLDLGRLLLRHDIADEAEGALMLTHQPLYVRIRPKELVLDSFDLLPQTSGTLNQLRVLRLLAFVEVVEPLAASSHHDLKLGQVLADIAAILLPLLVFEWLVRRFQQLEQTLLKRVDAKLRVNIILIQGVEFVVHEHLVRAQQLDTLLQLIQVLSIVFQLLSDVLLLPFQSCHLCFHTLQLRVEAGEGCLVVLLANLLDFLELFQVSVQLFHHGPSGLDPRLHWASKGREVRKVLHGLPQVGLQAFLHMLSCGRELAPQARVVGNIDCECLPDTLVLGLRVPDEPLDFHHLNCNFLLLPLQHGLLLVGLFQTILQGDQVSIRAGQGALDLHSPIFRVVEPGLVGVQVGIRTSHMLGELTDAVL